LSFAQVLGGSMILYLYGFVYFSSIILYTMFTHRVNLSLEVTCPRYVVLHSDESRRQRKRLHYNEVHVITIIKKRQNQELLEDGLREKNENLYTEWRRDL